MPDRWLRIRGGTVIDDTGRSFEPIVFLYRRRGGACPRAASSMTPIPCSSARAMSHRAPSTD
jgi:hypothetical protein